MSSTVSRPVAALAALAVLSACGKTGDDTPAAESGTSTRAAQTSQTTQTTTRPAEPSGEPVGTAVMRVEGSGTADIRYRINSGPEQTDNDVTLPWEKQFPVYEELENEVIADAGETILTCTIIMDGELLLAFKTEPRPNCDFMYFG